MRDQLKKVLYRTGVLGAWHRLRNRRLLTVVMFHRVLPADDSRLAEADPEYTVTDRVLDECLAFFVRHYAVVSLDSVLAASRGAARLPSRPLLITFDDGWADTEEYALPLLRKYGFPAVTFIATAAVDSPQPFWQEAIIAAVRTGTMEQGHWEALWRHVGGAQAADASPNVAAARRLIEALSCLAPAERGPLAGFLDAAPLSTRHAMVTPAQLASMHAAGMALGSHGETHEPLTTAEDFAGELKRPWQSLGRWVPGLAGATPTLSFPHGRYNDTIVETARASGYRLMFTSDPRLTRVGEPGMSDLIGRIGMPARAFVGSDDHVRPELLALWLFTRPIAQGKPA